MKHLVTFEDFVNENLNLNEGKLDPKKLVDLYNKENKTVDLTAVCWFIYDNFNKVTGLRKSDRDKEMQWPIEIKIFLNTIMDDDKWWNNNWEKFEDTYTMVIQ